MKQWAWTLLATVLSAFLFQAALPPVGWSALGWFCFVPTLLACRGKGFAVGFASGLFAVMGASFLARFGLWCKPSLLDGDPGWIYAGFALFGVPVGLLHGIVGEAKNTKWWTPLLFAAWAVLFEALLLLVLPANIALTQSRNSFMLILSSFTGIWGVSYLVWLANLAVAESLAQKHKVSSVTVSFVALVLSAGTLLVLQDAGSRGYHLTAVQAPLDDREFLLGSTMIGPSRNGIVVWPEASGSAFVVRGDTGQLVEQAKKDGVTPFATTFDDDFEPRPHNTMAAFTRDGESARYFKRELFGGEKMDHTPGQKPVVATVDGLPLGFNVCFDSCYPSVMRETALLSKVSVILLPTLDPASPYGICQAIHAAYTPFRAAELGVFIVRAEATASSMIVDHNGMILAEAPAGVKATITAITMATYKKTFYKEFGDWFLTFAGFFCLAANASKLRERASTEPRQD